MSTAKLPEINILLLGETGTGKSTTLNALANYLKYNSFERALDNVADFTEVVPSQFTLPNPQTGDPIVITSGEEDSYERVGGAQSATQIARGYTFPVNDDYVLRFIDTPGVGDARGADMDVNNFENIFTYLREHERLHAVLFIMKSGDTRKTAFYKYCITELLVHLHKSIVNNIIFCFTNSRNSMYGPGEGFSTLQEFLKNDIPDVQIDLVKDVNCFFIDNEAYRFMVAKKQGFNFPNFVIESYRTSWNASVRQIALLLENVCQRTPHLLEETISINSVRKIIGELVQPMVQVQKQVQENISVMQKIVAEYDKSTDLKASLQKMIYTEIDDVKMRPLPSPTTVCASNKCTEVINGKVTFKPCHRGCICPWVTPNVKDQKMIKFCQCMKTFSGIFQGSIDCADCGCNWSQHMHIMSEYYKVKVQVLDESVQAKITEKESDIERLDTALIELQKKEREYKEELEIIKQVSSKFAYILKSCSLLTHNHFFEEYINCLIDQESKLPDGNVEALKVMKEDYLEKVANFIQLIEENHEVPPTLQDVPKLKEQLLNLKYVGNQLQDILEKSKEAHGNTMGQADKLVLRVTHATLAAPKELKSKFGRFVKSLPKF